MSSQDTLLLGFSYSLAPDGSPGSYNRDIATAMSEWIDGQPEGADQPLIAAQWEIVDALAGQRTDITRVFAASPPMFAATDIADPKGLVELLRAGETAAARELSRLFCASLREVGYDSEGSDDASIYDRAGLNAERLAMYLNGFLSDPTMYRGFRHNVELHDLQRKQLGALGFEARQLPLRDDPLGKYQAIRVNRLIIEAVIPHEDILKRGTYLSTDGVLDRALGYFKENLAAIRRVCVFGFPGHSPRCCRQTIESFWRAGRRDITAKDVEDVRAVPRDQWQTLPWDNTTAQIWCRSLENWQNYESMGLRRR